MGSRLLKMIYCTNEDFAHWKILLSRMIFLREGKGKEMNITTANTYDIAPAVLKEHGFEPHKVIVNRGNGYTHEMILQARDESEVGSFMRNHWGWDTHYTVEKVI